MLINLLKLYASWLPWRRLVHLRGCELSFTPMHHAHLIVSDARYRDTVLSDLAESPRPVIVQLAANEGALFARLRNSRFTCFELPHQCYVILEFLNAS